MAWLVPLGLQLPDEGRCRLLTPFAQRCEGSDRSARRLSMVGEVRSARRLSMVGEVRSARRLPMLDEVRGARRPPRFREV
jgi:hypothetical protein